MGRVHPRGRPFGSAGGGGGERPCPLHSPEQVFWGGPTLGGMGRVHPGRRPFGGMGRRRPLGRVHPRRPWHLILSPALGVTGHLYYQWRWTLSVRGVRRYYYHSARSITWPPSLHPRIRGPPGQRRRCSFPEPGRSHWSAALWGELSWGVPSPEELVVSWGVPSPEELLVSWAVSSPEEPLISWDVPSPEE